MGGGAGAVSLLIHSVLIMLVAIPTHFLSYRYWRIHFIVRYLLISFFIVGVALFYAFAEWFYTGAEAAFYQPLEVWLWKNFVLSLFIAILAGIPFIVASLKK